jgi:hypothetical protein
VNKSMITIHLLNEFIKSNKDGAVGFTEQIVAQVSACYSNIFDGKINNFKNFILNDLRSRKGLKEDAKDNVDHLINFIQSIDINALDSDFNSIAKSIINEFIKFYELAAANTLFSIFDYQADAVFNDPRSSDNGNIKAENDILIKNIDSAISSISNAQDLKTVNQAINLTCQSYTKLAGRNQADITGSEVDAYMLNRGYVKSETIQGKNGTVLVFSSLEQADSKLYIGNNKDQQDHLGDHWFCVTPKESDAIQNNNVQVDDAQVDDVQVDELIDDNNDIQSTKIDDAIQNVATQSRYFNKNYIYTAIFLGLLSLWAARF